MPKQDNYYWRLFATGLSFAIFGIGGLLLRILVFPIFTCLPGNHQTMAKRSQKVVHHFFRWFIAVMKTLGVLTYEFNGEERLNRSCQLILSNHPSLIDVVFLMSRIRGANCIVKQGLWENPFTRGPVISAGYISNVNPEKMILSCIESLRSGDNLIIFPEGTRTVPGQPLKFHRGAAHIALRSSAVVTPVTILCYPTTLSKAEKWYQIPWRRAHFLLQVGKDLDLAPYLEEGPTPLAVRRLTRYLKEYFLHEIAKHEQQFGI